MQDMEGAVEQEPSEWGISPATPADRGLEMLSRSASRGLGEDFGRREGEGGGVQGPQGAVMVA